jgi:hypothetical protein
MLNDVNLTEGERKFINSLNQQATNGKRLTDNQIRALDRVLARYAHAIPTYDEIAQTLGLPPAAAAPEPDNESGALLALFKNISVWREAKSRGKRTFDDKAFIDSLANQFGQRQWLSPKQRAALKKMVVTYKEQIPDFETVATQYELVKPKTKKEKK